MKKTMQSLAALMLVILLAFSCAACKAAPATPAAESLWDTATYQADTELGSGAKTVNVEVKAGEKTVTFTLHTANETVGAALLEQNLIAGEDSAYGLYIKTVNGIKADYDTDGAYWAFYENGEYAMSGADTTNITDGVVYGFTYTKG